MERRLVVTEERLAGQRETVRRGLSQWQVLFIAVIGLAIGACEYIFAYQNVAYGIIALALAILIYVIISLFHPDQRIAACAESLALIPLYILFTSSLPWFFLDQQYLMPAVYSIILGLCLWHVYQKNLSLREIFGFSKGNPPSPSLSLEGRGTIYHSMRKTINSAFCSLNFKFVLLGLAIGIPLGAVEYLILHPAPAFPVFQVKYLFRDMVYMLCFVGLAEELLFRGLIQRDLTGAFGWKWALFGASLLFTVMHLTWRSIPELGFVFLAGLILGALYWKTKSLVAPIVAHGVNNVVLVSVLPYLLR